MSRVAVAALTCTLLVVGGSASAVVEDGGPGNDRIKGTDRSDTLRGKGGDDRLIGQGGDDQLIGGPGNDRFKAGSGVDDLAGGRGDDVMFPGFDHVVDNMGGGPGNDVLYILGADHASAGPGADTVSVIRPGPYYVDCGPGEDQLITGSPVRAETVVVGCEHIVTLP
jgi:hypothetical protein